jgi:hypothetical protein
MGSTPSSEIIWHTFVTDGGLAHSIDIRPRTRRLLLYSRMPPFGIFSTNAKLLKNELDAGGHNGHQRSHVDPGRVR